MLKSTVIVLSLAVTAIPAAPQTRVEAQRGFVPATTARQNRQTAPPKAGDPREVVQQFFDAYRTVDADRLASLFADGAVFEDPTFRQRHQGRDAIRKTAMDMRATFRDVAIDVHSMVIDGDAVATEETVSGVVAHRDGSPRPIKVRSASFFRIRNGRIETLTQYSDVQTFNEQMRGGR